MAHLQAVTAAREIFEPLGIPWAVLKGAALAERFYDEPSSRACGDVDIIVLERDRARAESALLAGGFRPSPHHRELFTSRSGQIDLHTSFINSERIERPEITPRWQDRIEHVGSIPVLGMDDLGLYLSAHFLHHHGGVGARWLVDILRMPSDSPNALVRMLADQARGKHVCARGIDRIVLNASFRGEEVPGLRFLLTLREIPTIGARARFLRQAILPDRKTLRSAHLKARSPLAAHLRGIWGTARSLIKYRP